MSGHHRLAAGLAGAVGLLGLTVMSSLALLANRFVEELSRPHMELDDTLFCDSFPQCSTEPTLVLQRALRFKTTDGVVLSGDFWAQPHPAPTIVLCHGYRMTRAYLRPVASLEYAHGYNVLSFDFRGHGESESVKTSGGNAEVQDLEAALEVAIRQPETLPAQIIIHGFSMGAAVALLTPPCSSVIAIVADSPYAHSDDILRRMVHYQLTQQSDAWRTSLRKLQRLWPAIAWLTVLVSSVVFRLRFGYDVIAHPATSFKRWRMAARSMRMKHVIPLLLIHSAGDTLVPIQHARQIAAAARLYNVPIETYFAEDEAHCGAYAFNPEVYVQVLQRFIAHSLQGSFYAQSQKID